jgi:hypothetical protein
MDGTKDLNDNTSSTETGHHVALPAAAMASAFGMPTGESHSLGDLPAVFLCGYRVPGTWLGLPGMPPASGTVRIGGRSPPRPSLGG